VGFEEVFESMYFGFGLILRFGGISSDCENQKKQSRDFNG